MDKYTRVAKKIAGEALSWPPAGPCASELWEEVRAILIHEFPGNEIIPDPPIFNSEEPHTFNEWSENGYRIKKGEHATGKNKENKHTFTRDQVYSNNDIVVATYDCDEDIF